METMEIRQTIKLFKVKELLSYIKEDKIKFFDVGQARVRTIRNYLVDNILNNEIYLPPIVIATNLKNETDNSRELTIIDGNGRLNALSQIELVVQKKEKSLNMEEIAESEALRIFINEGVVAAQIYHGLTDEKVKQIYVDLNTKGKKVALSKLISYDSRNEINRISNEVLDQNVQLNIAGVELELKSLIKPNNKSFLTLSQLRKLIATFFTCEIKSELPKGPIKNKLSYEENIETINLWFSILFKLRSPESIGDYNQTILASFPFLQSLCYYAVKDTQKLDFESKKKIIEGRMLKLTDFDFSTDRTEWENFNGVRKGKGNYFYFSPNKENILRIEKWITEFTKNRSDAH
jgi:hypothetical protein